MLRPALLLVVAAALVDREGRVLVQQRPPGKPMADLWEFPGGKVEADEVPEAALVRELAEELGIGVDARALTPTAFASEALGERHLLLLLYVLREWEGVPEARHASALRWVPPQAARDGDAACRPAADRRARAVALVFGLERVRQRGSGAAGAGGLGL